MTMELDKYSTVFVQRKSKLTALKKLMSYRSKTASKVKKIHCLRNLESTSKWMDRRGTTRTHVNLSINASNMEGRMCVRDKHVSSYNKNGTYVGKKIKRIAIGSEKIVPDTISPSKSCSTRRILFRKSDMPKVSQLKTPAMRKAGISGSDDEMGYHRWSEGQMLWGKIRGYPFWPCMVSRDPFSKLFTKAAGSYKNSRSYHVQFFGAEAERSWIQEASLLEFEGREKFLEIVQYGLENPDVSSKTPNDFKVSSAWYPTWRLAVAEAEAAHKLHLEARMNKYMFQYMIVKGEIQKPIDDLLEKIWHHSDSSLVANKEKSDTDDDASLYSEIFNTRKERPWYDSDDVYSSDESSADTPNKRPVKIVVREGLFEVFMTKHLVFVQIDHPDWNRSQIVSYLRQQWSFMSNLQRSRYTSRNRKPAVFVDDRKYTRQISETVENDDHIDTTKLDLQILKLSRTFRYTESGEFCLICHGRGSNFVYCKGSCGRYFHPACVTEQENYGSKCPDGSKCPGCNSDNSLCFACKKSSLDIVKCSQKKCKKYYHTRCAANLGLTITDSTIFTCPLHNCATCTVSGSSNAQKGSFIECVLCPTAYHASDFCIAAGSQVLGRNHLVCSYHFQAKKTESQHARVNMKRCLECGEGGDSLLLCQQCPAAYHDGCDSKTPLNLSTLIQFRFNIASACESSLAGKQLRLCSHCLIGTKLQYGDIVWVKHGVYRWWPGEICHPLRVPKKVQEKRHQIGEFAVRFFGSHDFAWVHQGRVISFDRVTKRCRDGLMSSGDKVFFLGVQEATVASRLCASIGRKE